VPLIAAATRTALLLIALAAQPLMAEENPGGGAPTGTSVTVGAGGLVMPEYPGADTYRNRAVPWIDIRVGDRLQLNAIQGLRYAALSAHGWQAGPFVGYQGGRTNRAAIRDLDNVSGGAIVGGFVSYRLGPLRFQGDLANAATGDIAGSRANLGVTLNGRAGRHWLFGVGPRATWYSRNWQRGRYGVTPQDAGQSDLSAYEPGSGITEYRFTARATYLASHQWNATAYAGVTRISGSAADSPIVDEVGRRTQGMIGTVIGYRF